MMPFIGQMEVQQSTLAANHDAPDDVDPTNRVLATATPQ